MESTWFNYHKSKVIQALRYHFISRKEIKIMLILVNVYAISSAALFFLKKISPLAFLAGSFLWFILMIVFWYALPVIIYNKQRTFKDRFKVRMDDSGFTLENGQSARTWPWTDFSNWIESPHFFHVYFNSRSFFIIPKEAFPDDQEHVARNIIKQKIKK